MHRHSDEIETPYVLLTYFGTLVYFDAATSRLRHGKIGGCDANVHAVPRGTDVGLIWQDGNRARPIAHFAPGLCTVVANDSHTKLTAYFIRQKLIALSLDGRYLAPELDGNMTMSAIKARERDIFLLVKTKDLATLNFILANHWVSSTNGQVIDPLTIRCTERHMIEIGRIRVQIEEVLRAANAGSTRDLSPRELVLRVGGWQLEHFVLLRPLVYLVAYGKEEVFQCAEIAIRTLFDFGQWDGDVLLVTDENGRDFANRLPQIIQNRLHFIEIPAHDILDYTLARYKAIEAELFDTYQPVLYLDVDMVCDAPLRPALQSLARSSSLQLYAEFLLAHDEDYYGKSLFAVDGVTFDAQRRGVSSGIFAFRQAEQQRILFRQIVHSAYSFSVTAGRRDTHLYYDQPFFNYVIHKTNSGHIGLMNKIVHTHYSSQPPLTAKIGKGLVHFAGGVGNVVPKIKQMADYVKILTDARPG